MAASHGLDRRLGVLPLIDVICQEGCDVLLIGAPSFFRDSRRKHKTEDGLQSRVGALLMGDQDIEPSHAIFQLKGLLQKLGLRVRCLDMNLLHFLQLRDSNGLDPAASLSKILREASPTLVGVSSMRSNLCEAIKCARTVRDTLPAATIVLGGPAAMVPGLKDASFDIIMRSKNLHSVALKILGLVDTTLRHSASPSTIIPIDDAFCLPDYGDVPKEIPLIPRVFSSHGCSAGCEFCFPAAELNFRVRVYDDHDVLAALRKMRDEFVFDYFLFGDLTFYLNSPAVQRLLHNIEVGNFPQWWCQTQANLLTQDRIGHLRTAGCRQLAIGIEDLLTANIPIRRKNSGWNKTVQVLEETKNAGIQTQTYWIFGLPDDDASRCATRIEQMIRLVERGLIDSVHLSYLMPYPGTPIGDTPERFGVRIVSSFEEHYEQVESDFYSPPPVHEVSKLTRDNMHEWFQLAKKTAASLYK